MVRDVFPIEGLDRRLARFYPGGDIKYIMSPDRTTERNGFRPSEDNSAYYRTKEHYSVDAAHEKQDIPLCELIDNELGMDAQVFRSCGSSTHLSSPYYPRGEGFKTLRSGVYFEK